MKQGDGCSIRYGRESYDYQEGTVVSFAPGQTVTVEWNTIMPMPPSRGLLFHPDLLHGTQLGKKISEYTFFDYGQREALHVSERERTVISSLLDQIETEIENPVDRHSQTLPKKRASAPAILATLSKKKPAQRLRVTSKMQ